MSTEIAARGSLALPADEMSAVEALFPGDRETAIRAARLIQYLRSQFTHDVMQGCQEQLLVRIADYMRRYRMTIGDVGEVFRAIASPDVAARIGFGAHLLQEFSRAVPLVMRARRDREDKAARDNAEEEARAWRNTPEGQAAWAKLRAHISTMFTTVTDGQSSPSQRGRRGEGKDTGEAETETQRGRGKEATGGAKKEAQKGRRKS